MAVALDEIKQFYEEKPQVTQSIQEYIAQNTAGFTASMTSSEALFKQTVAGGSYFPTELDPDIPNTVLYGRAPAMTRMESYPGMKTPTTTTSVKYLKHTQGFISESINDIDAGSNPQDQTLVPTTTNVNVHITKFSLSDLLNMGFAIDAGIKEEVIQLALEGQREYMDMLMLAGNHTSSTEYMGSTSANGTQFDGLYTQVPSANVTSNAGDSLTLSSLYSLEQHLREDLKGIPTVIYTSSAVLGQLRQEMTAMQREITATAKISGEAGMLSPTPVEVVAGVTVPAYQSETGPIPIITSPWMPRTAGSRALLMLDETTVKFREFATPYVVTLAKNKPVATDFSVVQMNTMYNKVPEKSVAIDNIA